MQALVFWEPAGLSLDRANPYAALLARAMEAEGVHSVAGFRENLTPDWLRANRAEAKTAAQAQIAKLHPRPWSRVASEYLEIFRDIAAAA